jgi:hypothetical protein
MDGSIAWLGSVLPQWRDRSLDLFLDGEHTHEHGLSVMTGSGPKGMQYAHERSFRQYILFGLCLAYSQREREEIDEENVLTERGEGIDRRSGFSRMSRDSCPMFLEVDLSLSASDLRLEIRHSGSKQI